VTDTSILAVEPAAGDRRAAGAALLQALRRALTGAGALSTGFVVFGTTLLAIAWLARSEPTMYAGAGATASGSLLPVIVLAARGKIGALSAAAKAVGALFILQLLHTIEHVVQLTQVYRLDRPGMSSQGIVSTLNVEWVHFSWNWIVLGVLVWAGLRGVRTRWSAPLVVWVAAHTAEHSYMLVNYLAMTRRLDRLGLPRFAVAEVLPGFLGRDGWLALNRPEWRTTLGPLVSAPRVTVHFWWNVGELALLALVTIAVVGHTIREAEPRPNSEGSKP
jgi:hypothetical protein